MAPLIDIHAHYRIDSEPHEGVTVYSYRIGVDETMPPYPFVAGIHPWDAGLTDIEKKIAMLENIPTCGIGEVGLDYACRVDRALQEKIFRLQLQIAQRRRLPVVIHCVRAIDDTLKILSSYDITSVIFHGFIGNSIQLGSVLKSGAYISLGATSLTSRKTLDALSKIPLNRIFIETDDSGMSINCMYEKACVQLKVDLDELATACYENYLRLFGQTTK